MNLGPYHGLCIVCELFIYKYLRKQDLNVLDHFTE